MSSSASRFMTPARIARATAITAPAAPGRRIPSSSTVAVVGTTNASSVRSAAIRIATALTTKARKKSRTDRFRYQISGSKRHR